MKLISWIKKLNWIRHGRPLVHYLGYNCGCCGKWWSIAFDIPEYESCGEWWDMWGLCPIPELCNKDLSDKQITAIEKLWNEEPYFCSTDIHDKTTYGYDYLDDFGFFEYSLKKEWIYEYHNFKNENL